MGRRLKKEEMKRRDLLRKSDLEGPCTRSAATRGREHLTGEVDHWDTDRGRQFGRLGNRCGPLGEELFASGPASKRCSTSASKQGVFSAGERQRKDSWGEVGLWHQGWEVTG